MPKLSEAQKRVLRTMQRFAAEEIEVIRPMGGKASYCSRDARPLRGPHWRTLSAMERKGLLESDWGVDADLVVFYLTPRGREVAKELEEQDAQD